MGLFNKNKHNNNEDTGTRGSSEYDPNRGTGNTATGQDFGRSGDRNMAGRGAGQNGDRNMAGRGADGDRNLAGRGADQGGDRNMAGSGAGQNTGQNSWETGQVDHHHRNRDGKSSSNAPLIGSESLQTKVQRQELEMNSVKAQSSELSEAERLEKEAQMHRERAVAHGAHPGNRDLGSSQLPSNYNRT